VDILEGRAFSWIVGKHSELLGGRRLVKNEIQVFFNLQVVFKQLSSPILEKQ